jgi:hypothetical protein
MKFREHRGSLAESMLTVVDLNTKKEFCDHISKVARKIVPEGEFTISFSDYSFDIRINWDTFLVMLEGYGPIGMLNGPPPISWWPPVEFVYGSEENND